MSQNTSSAVMAQRKEPPDSLDFFPTPPWATRALCEHVLTGHGWRKDNLAAASSWDPCCGQGHMVRPLSEYFASVRASDVFDYGQTEVSDFLFAYLGARPVDFLIFNPPFMLAKEFILAALKIARQAVCALVRTSFLEGQERYAELYSVHPPQIVAQFAERVIMTKGICRDPNKPYWDAEAIDKKTGKPGVWKRPSTATSYCWLVWGGTKFTAYRSDPASLWIPPCRSRLERAGDYEAAP